MTDALPAPLVPHDVDITGLDGFMLDVQRLFSSELWALSTGDEFKAALALWGRAWQQSPPGSLPDDERILAAFSGNPAKWRKLRDMAMRGFVKCSDGRWYHKTLCEDVLRAADKREKFKARTRAATEARRQRDGSKDDRNDQRNDGRNVIDDDATTSNVTSVQGQGQGQGQKERTPDGVPKKAPDPRGSRLPDGFEVSAEMREWAVENGMTSGTISNETAKFVDYWKSKPGADGRKTDWNATWRNWMRKSFADPTPKAADLGRAWI